MVSKSKIYRQPFIVFVTVGSTNIPFTRLNKAILNCKSLCLSKYSFRNDLSEEQLISCISHAEKIIIHASPSSLYLVTKFARYMPLILPRRVTLKEAVGDHQFHYAQYIKRNLPKKYKKFVITDLEISYALNIYLSQKKEKNVLQNYLFPISSQEIFKKSFSKLLQQEAILQ